MLDVRSDERFAAGHVPGSINIPLSGQFASWAGAILGLSSQLVLVADSPEQLQEGRLRLSRVGIEVERGYLEGGVEGWRKAGFPLASLQQITVRNLHERMCAGDLRVLDVRREAEWQTGHISGAAWWPLDKFNAALPMADKNAPIAVHCKSGYRSAIACSLLQRAGFHNVINVVGGFDAWRQEQLPVAFEAAVEA